jgi:hypothetical protein
MSSLGFGDGVEFNNTKENRIRGGDSVCPAAFGHLAGWQAGDSLSGMLPIGQPPDLQGARFL